MSTGHLFECYYDFLSIAYLSIKQFNLPVFLFDQLLGDIQVPHKLQEFLPDCLSDELNEHAPHTRKNYGDVADYNGPPCNKENGCKLFN